MLLTKAVEAGPKGATSGSSLLRPCTTPRELASAQVPLRHGSGGRLPRLTLKRPRLTFEARSMSREVGILLVTPLQIQQQLATNITALPPPLANAMDLSKLTVL